LCPTGSCIDVQLCFQTNCLTEIFVDRALARAKELDDHLAITGQVVGSLHGLPISLKDQFTMKGLETIMGVFILSSHGIRFLPIFVGYVAWIGEYADSDCVLVEILYEWYVKRSGPIFTQPTLSMKVGLSRSYVRMSLKRLW